MNYIVIQRAHRIGKVVAGKPRPIIARVLQFPDKKRILRLAAIHLKENNHMVLQDFSQEIFNILSQNTADCIEHTRIVGNFCLWLIFSSISILILI